MESDEKEQVQIKELILENQRLLSENNQLLKQMNWRSVIGFWLRFAWTMVLIGLPFVLYYYVLEPYFTSFGSSFEIFRAGMQEVPGWKQFYEAASSGRE